MRPPNKLHRALLVGLLAGAAACSRSAPPARSAMLVTLDTTRWDALGYNGVHPELTPNLDALGEESLTYDFAHTVAPITLPAHASMLTGLNPPRHTVRDNGFQALPGTAHTLAEAAREAGAQTAAFVAATVMDRAFGLDQGFDVFRVPARARQQATATFVEKDGAVVVDEALDWLGRRDRERPFFVWLHLFDPHDPYAPRPEHMQRARSNPLYFGEVGHVDAVLGRLFDGLRADGTLDEATVMVVADHGESLSEHRETTHSHFCYEATLKVPLLLRFADGYRAGEHSDEVVSVVDVFPTLTEALGLPVPTDVDGLSLFQRSVPPGRGAYFESYAGYFGFGWSPLAGWLDSDGKYIHSSEPEFYDVAADPGEAQNLFGESGVDVSEYRRALSKVASRPALVAEEEAVIDGALMEQIQSLGYATLGPLPSALPGPLAETGLPSPASMVDTYEECLDALALAEEGRFAEALEGFERVLERNPRNWLALERAGFALISLQRQEEAIPYLRLVVEEGPQRAGTYFNLGISLFAVGQVDGAIDAVERAAELDPGEPIFLRQLARYLAQAGRRPEAREVRKRLGELERRP